MIVEVTGSAVPRLTRREVTTFVRKVLLALRKDEEITDVSIAFIDDETMKGLNRKFRRQNKTLRLLRVGSEFRATHAEGKRRPFRRILFAEEFVVLTFAFPRHQSADSFSEMLRLR